MEAERAEEAWMGDLSARVAPAGAAEESVVVNLPMTGVGTVQAAELAEECGVVRSQAVAGAAQTERGWAFLEETDPPGL